MNYKNFDFEINSYITNEATGLIVFPLIQLKILLGLYASSLLGL
jgi:hypothetical protein